MVYFYHEIVVAASKINALDLHMLTEIISKTREWGKNASRLDALGYKQYSTLFKETRICSKYIKLCMRIIHIYFKAVVLSGRIGRAGMRGQGEEEWEGRF